MSRARARWVSAAGATCLFLAATLRFLPVATPHPAPQPDTLSPTIQVVELPARTGQWDAYSEIVAGNVLSPTRQAAESSTTPEPEGPSARDFPVSLRPPYQLTGIVQGPDGIVALIDADSEIPGAEVYRVGDTVGRYVLVEATDSTAVLRRSGETHVLKLNPT